MIQLTANHLQQITSHAESTYPEECCGLLLGKIAGEPTQVIEVIATENSWNAEDFASFSFNRGSKRNRFSIAPAILLKVQKLARDRNLLIVGIYHSHPDHVAIPSEFDRQIAWPNYSYLIAAVPQGKVSDICAWKLDENHQFQSEASRWL
jgi:proteasome lid subunit RPN8/RPN11